MVPELGEEGASHLGKRSRSPPGAPWAPPVLSGVLKRAQAKKRRISGPKNQRRGGAKRVFLAPKWRKKTPKSPKNREKVDKIMEKRHFLKNATPPI